MKIAKYKKNISELDLYIFQYRVKTKRMAHGVRNGRAKDSV